MRVLSGLVLLAVVAFTAGCSSDPEAEKESGSPARAIGKSLTLTQRLGSAAVTLVSVTESYKPNNDISKAVSGNFVMVELKFECQEGEFSANPLYLRLKKSDGKIIDINEGDATFAQPEQDFSDSLGDLTAGKSVTGGAVFDTVYDPGASLLITNTSGHVTGEWPLSGGEPRAGDGSTKREVNETKTHKQTDDQSASVTFVSITESKGGLDDQSKPESGNFVIVELTFEGKEDGYSVNSLYVKLQKADGSFIDDTVGNGSFGAPAEEQLETGDLAVGDTMTGKVAFDTALEPGMKLVVVDIDDEVTAEWPLS